MTRRGDLGVPDSAVPDAFRRRVDALVAVARAGAYELLGEPPPVNGHRLEHDEFLDVGGLTGRGVTEEEVVDARGVIDHAGNGDTAGTPEPRQCKTPGCGNAANDRYDRGPFYGLCDEVCVPLERKAASDRSIAARSRRRGEQPAAPAAGADGLPSGIRLRHQRACAGSRGAGCTCQPRFEALVKVNRRQVASRRFESIDDAVAWRDEQIAARDGDAPTAVDPTPADPAQSVLSALVAEADAAQAALAAAHDRYRQAAAAVADAIRVHHPEVASALRD